MGDRSIIVIESEQFEVPLSFYGHWAGGDHLDAVRDVIEETDRIGDAGYLAAQIFYKFAVMYGNYQGKLGYAIYPCELQGWSDNARVFVNADTGAIRIEGEDDV